MKSFITRIFIFVLFIVSLHFVIYTLLNVFNSYSSSSKPLFIFGDSQTVQGLDLKELKKDTKYSIHSAAIHGAGIYDFYVFVDKVPDNADVVLSISKLAQIRPDDKEANTSPLNYKAFFNLWTAGYSKNGLKNILYRTIKLPFQKYYKTSSNLYPNRDTVTVKQALKIFKKRYTISEEKLMVKQGLYLKGIEELIKKKCKITFIEFPFHPILKRIDEESVLQNNLIKFRDNISKMFPDFKKASIELPKGENLMYDYSHLNKRGANILTNIFAKEMGKEKRINIYIVN